MSGHGGDGFLKFQDNEELLSLELLDTFIEMRRNRRFNEIFLMIDSCQATTMFSPLTLPGILAAASSKQGEDSLSHHFDNSLGLHLMDKWTYYLLLYLENISPLSNISIESLLNSFDARLIQSTPSYKNVQLSRDLHLIPLKDFFGSIRSVHLNEIQTTICYSQEQKRNVSCAYDSPLNDTIQIEFCYFISSFNAQDHSNCIFRSLNNLNLFLVGYVIIFIAILFTIFE